MTSRRLRYTTPARRFGSYAFALTASSTPYPDHFDVLFDGFETCDADREGVLSIEILQDDGGEELVMIDGEVFARDVVLGRSTSTLVHTLTRQMIEACDGLGIHAGGVVRDGIGIALPAHMESGKSTLTTGLVRAGFDYLSDEAVILDWKSLMVIPFPKPISLDPGSWHLFPELEPQAPLPPGYKDTQWQVPPSAIRPDAVGGPCKIQYFVFPKYAEGTETRLTPIRRAAATIELAKNTFRFNERPRRSLDALAIAVRGADCYELDIGDLETAVRLVSALVEDVQ